MREATTLGAAFLAGLAVGTWARLGRHRRHLAPRRRRRAAARRSTASAGARPCDRAAGWFPELSAITF